MQNLTFVPVTFLSWSKYSAHHLSRLFLDHDLHPLFAIFPECMLIVHSVHLKIHRRLHVFFCGLDENVGLSSPELQNMSYLLRSTFDDIDLTIH